MERQLPAPPMMRCFVCKSGSVKPGRATYFVERGGHVAVIRDVPAEVCEQCGEEYFESETARLVYDMAERLLTEGGEVEIKKFAA